jgi:hypothetical protein
MTKIDLIKEHEAGPHTDLVGISGESQNPVGGWFSVLALTCVPVYIAVLSTEFWFDNVRESQALQPNFIWGAGGETMAADMLATIKLEGYSAAQCSLPGGACAADIRLDAVGMTGARSTRCFSSSAGSACHLEWRCDKCSMPGTTGKLKATFGVAGTYAYKLVWNVTSTTGFGPGTGNGGGYESFTYIEPNLGQNSSLAGWVLPEVESAFRGPEPTTIALQRTPSLFENLPLKTDSFSAKTSGYILQWLDSYRGSQVTVDTLDTTDRVLVDIVIEKAPSTIQTTREELQTFATFMPAVFATYLGLLALFASGMGYFEQLKAMVKPDYPLDLLDEMVRDWLLTKAPQYVEERDEKESHELDKWLIADPNEEEEEEKDAEEGDGELAETANPLGGGHTAFKLGDQDADSGTNSGTTVGASGATFEVESGDAT